MPFVWIFHLLFHYLLCRKYVISIQYNSIELIYTCTEVFRLVDTKFADSAELNLCSLKLRPLHLYDSIICSLEFILHMRKFYRSTNLKTAVQRFSGWTLLTVTHLFVATFCFLLCIFLKCLSPWPLGWEFGGYSQGCR